MTIDSSENGEDHSMVQDDVIESTTKGCSLEKEKVSPTILQIDKGDSSPTESTHHTVDIMQKSRLGIATCSCLASWQTWKYTQVRYYRFANNILNCSFHFHLSVPLETKWTISKRTRVCFH